LAPNTKKEPADLSDGSFLAGTPSKTSIRSVAVALDVREEVLNVVLADLLQSRGLLSVPETIQKSVKGKKLPDITVADLFGLRVVIEGRIGTTPAVRSTLFHDAKKRVLDGIAPLCLAVLYPKDLRAVETLPALRKALDKAVLEVRAISDSDDGAWAQATVDNIADILRSSYELLISDDVVTKSVAELGNVIESTTQAIVATKATPERLAELLGIPEPEDEDDEDED
jgi:hypothetical protein